jgi:polyferredoxin
VTGRHESEPRTRTSRPIRVLIAATWLGIGLAALGLVVRASLFFVVAMCLVAIGTAAWAYALDRADNHEP